METIYNDNETIFDINYTISWEDIENKEYEYDDLLNEIETFFREDFDNEITESFL